MWDSEWLERHFLWHCKTFWRPPRSCSVFSITVEDELLEYNPIHVYLEVNPIIVNRAYSQGRVDRTAALSPSSRLSCIGTSTYCTCNYTGRNYCIGREELSLPSDCMTTEKLGTCAITRNHIAFVLYLISEWLHNCGGGRALVCCSSSLVAARAWPPLW